jgi:hypothetical protein
MNSSQFSIFEVKINVAGIVHDSTSLQEIIFYSEKSVRLYMHLP